jgi:hypothetical protein
MDQNNAAMSDHSVPASVAVAVDVSAGISIMGIAVPPFSGTR